DVAGVRWFCPWSGCVNLPEVQAARTRVLAAGKTAGRCRSHSPWPDGVFCFRGAGPDILGHPGGAKLLVDRLRLLALALGPKDIGTAKQAFAYGNPINLGRAREGFLQGGDCVERADPAQGPRRGLHDFGIRIVEPLDQRSNSLG